jgi:glycerol-3-phosphate acyltransferase PlsY
MKILIALIIAYLLGSIPSGIWIGKLFFNVNLREHGSGNSGTTNTFRILGKKAGIVVFLIDVLKGTLATMLPSLMGIEGISPVWFGLLAVLGHSFSIFDRFRGGKAVATTAGLILGYSPMMFGILFIVFLISLYITSMVSFSSILIAILVFLSAVTFYHNDIIFVLIMTFIAAFVIYKHRDNIARIKAHKENLVSFGLNIFKQNPQK